MKTLSDPFLAFLFYFGGEEDGGIVTMAEVTGISLRLTEGVFLRPLLEKSLFLKKHQVSFYNT